MIRLEEMFFFFNDTATTEIYTLSLHDALPISSRSVGVISTPSRPASVPAMIRHESAVPSALMISQISAGRAAGSAKRWRDRKSTRLNSSHANISYAVFCLKKKKYLTPHIFHPD